MGPQQPQQQQQPGSSFLQSQAAPPGSLFPSGGYSGGGRGMPAMNGFSRQPQQGPPGHNQPNSAHLQRGSAGSVGHNHRGGLTALGNSMGGGLGGVTSIGGVGGQLSVGLAMPNRQTGGMQANPAPRSSMLGAGHLSQNSGGPGQIPNPLSVGGRPSGGSSAFSSGVGEMPFAMAGKGSSVIGALGGGSLMSGGDSELAPMQADLAPSFGVEDFPTLGGGAPPPARNPAGESMAPILGSLGSAKLGQAFQMADSDFPSLAPSKKAPAEQRVPQPAALAGHKDELQLGGNLTKGGLAPPSDVRGASPWGLLGLLNVIQMTSADLTTLGLDLNSTEPLYSTFASPWADTPCQREPEFSVPMCYYMQPPTLKTGHIQKFQLETLFYIFYMLPKDTLQAVAASELHSRDWKFHSELGMWFCKQPESGKGGFSRPSTYVYFDVKVWERRSYVDSNKNLEQGFLDEDAMRMR